ncbi:hypothetical protein ACFO6R_16000 [Eubacterium multiforme]|uniref:CRP-like cAMP-binding protein n=1 Tax=Eubacterium multiforme TaxID=83339 RepID=A0ABT9UTJ4_9FIRM|nr:hypothetical protein [Eubacterium multiforme]MDQ0149635.1 CRP-like cAMP-binding protein [Eubacterium multiforme]
MFDGLALVLEIISDTEIKVYTLDTKENIVLTASKGDIVGLKDMFETEETVIVPYNIKNKTLDGVIVLEDEGVEEFIQ